jgi:phosphatidylglycerophosphate synthase
MANVGGIDRILRAVIGLALIAFGVVYGNYWWILGLVLAGTAVFRFCGLYKVLGVSTCPMAKQPPN